MSRKRPLKCGAEYPSDQQGRGKVSADGVPLKFRMRTALLRYVRMQLRNSGLSFQAAPRISAGSTYVMIKCRKLRGAAVNSIVPFYCMFLFLARRCCTRIRSFNVFLEHRINSLLRCAALQNSRGVFRPPSPPRKGSRGVSPFMFLVSKRGPFPSTVWG